MKNKMDAVIVAALLLAYVPGLCPTLPTPAALIESCTDERFAEDGYTEDSPVDGL